MTSNERRKQGFLLDLNPKYPSKGFSRLLASFLGVICFRVILDLCYVTCIVPVYSYLYPFEFSYDSLSYAVSWLFLLAYVPLCFAARRNTAPSDLIVATLFLLSVVPTSSLFAFQALPLSFLVAFGLFWLVFLSLSRMSLPFHMSQIPLRVRQILGVVVIALLCGSVLYASWTYTGFRISLDLDAVYDLRLEAREYSLPFPLPYLIGIAKVALPLFSVYYLWKRQYALFGLMCVIQLLLFSLDGSKSSLFSLALMALVFLCIRRPSKLLILGLLTLGAFLCLVAYLAFARPEMLSYLVRRMMFVPALLNAEYFDFFQTHPIDLYAQSLLSKIGFDSNYNEGIPFIIASIYHGAPEQSANNGLFADAYANLGIVGCIIMPALYVALLRLFDACVAKLPLRFSFAATVPLVITLISSSFFTALISHGLVFYLVILLLLSRCHEEFGQNDALRPAVTDPDESLSVVFSH
ncbi:MAG: hypothetical protein UCH28_09135 [Adlercreutzia sp.]|nr:hypothetical protein [Adlercreutzia sp.]